VLQKDRDCEGFHKVEPKKTQRSAGHCEQDHISMLPGKESSTVHQRDARADNAGILARRLRILSRLIVGSKSLASTSKRFSPGGSYLSAREDASERALRRDLGSLRIFRSPDRQGGGGLDESNPGPRGRGPIRDRSGRAARSRTWEGVAPSPEPVEAREPLSGEGGGPRDESAPERADRARERFVSEAAGGGAARRSRSFAPVASSDLVARPSRLVERAPGCAPGTLRGEASTRSARLRARL